MGIEQVIYSPELVTNILVKSKQVNFQKAEKLLTEQSVGLEVAQLYVETLMLENLIQIQKEYVKESREDLAIARVREKMGKCGPEEGLRWAAQLNTNERKLVEMNSELANLKININDLLGQPTTTEFDLAELKASDPAFYTREINIIDYVSTPKYLEEFTQMLIDESYKVSLNSSIPRIIGKNKSVSKFESASWKIQAQRSSPAPVSMFLLGSSLYSERSFPSSELN